MDTNNVIALRHQINNKKIITLVQFVLSFFQTLFNKINEFAISQKN